MNTTLISSMGSRQDTMLLNTNAGFSEESFINQLLGFSLDTIEKNPPPAKKLDENIFEHYASFDEENLTFMLNNNQILIENIDEYFNNTSNQQFEPLNSFFYKLFSKIDEKHNTELTEKFQSLANKYFSENNDVPKQKESVKMIFSAMNEHFNNNEIKKFDNNISSNFQNDFLLDKLTNIFSNNNNGLSNSNFLIEKSPYFELLSDSKQKLSEANDFIAKLQINNSTDSEAALAKIKDLFTSLTPSNEQKLRSDFNTLTYQYDVQNSASKPEFMNKLSLVFNEIKYRFNNNEMKNLETTITDKHNISLLLDKISSIEISSKNDIVKEVRINNFNNNLFNNKVKFINNHTTINDIISQLDSEYKTEFKQEFIKLATEGKSGSLNNNNQSINDGKTINNKLNNNNLDNNIELPNTNGNITLTTNQKSAKLETTVNSIARQIQTEMASVANSSNLDNSTRKELNSASINNDLIDKDDLMSFEKMFNFSQSGEDFSRNGGESTNLDNYKKAIFGNLNKIISNSNVKFETIENGEQNVKTQYNQLFNNIRINNFGNTALGFIRSIPQNATGTARLVLNPESLGMVFVEISMKGNVASVNIKAQSQETLKSLEGQIALLKDNLKQSGIETNRIETSLANNDKNDENQYLSGNKNGEKGADKERREFVRSFKNTTNNDNNETDDSEFKTRFFSEKLIEKYV